MKVFLVYKISKNKEGEHLVHPLLYGYTDNKKTIKAFKKERDMSQFHIIEKDIDYSDFRQIEKSNKYQYIDIRKYTTYRKTESDFIKDYVEISSTAYEEEQTYIASDSAIFQASKYTKYPDYIFNKDIQKALSKLMYNSIKAYGASNFTNFMYPAFPAGKHINESINIDMFYVFMYIYGYTMRKE